ncbi:hypothetical protein E4T56_gene10299 [Termitomyces sp. T112]|nr:hypothetical protein E4T56_gene10299 [Termitomyces sp. T112]
MAVVQRRNNGPGSGTLAPVDIAGFCIAGAIMLGLVAWAFITFTRRRARAKTKSMHNGALPSVPGFVKEGMPSHIEKTLADIQIGFRRRRIDNSIALPDKVLQRPCKHYTSNDVNEYHRQSRMFHKPFSFVLSANPSQDQAHLSANIHESILISAGRSRFSAFSINSSVDSNPTTGTAYQVKRAFDPVLPDELLIRVGESLTLVQSLDDGPTRSQAMELNSASYLPGVSSGLLPASMQKGRSEATA